ncbi:hypothetical protein [Streptomyces chrestomyceticus]|uniref:hypothetical protein n=1 Tax=Streptomyces chrestomyceticus TaxID=68185 RepID=UPI0033CA2EBE
MSEEATRFGASRIQVLKGRDVVRKRPGMYVGSTGERGLRRMVFELADRAVNEVLSGRATRVDVMLTPDGGVRVTDDGPGVPLDEPGGRRAAPDSKPCSPRCRPGRVPAAATR